VNEATKVVDNLMWMLNNKVYNTLHPSEKQIIYQAANMIEKLCETIKTKETLNG
jgi:TRAP-type C4-dicarboxylate transport system substrate-binding protein